MNLGSNADVRQIERRIAPFWRGLNDHSDSWTEYQLVAAARGRPIPAPDAIPSEDQYGSPAFKDQKAQISKNFNHLTVPITSRSQSYNSDSSSNLSLPSPPLPSPGHILPASAPSSGSAIFRGRAKTLASLTPSSKGPQTEMTPRERNLPKDPFVNGQPMEAYLYKDATECPICFLYYPPYLNKTRCCDQAICSECFVQIKRPDPHPPEHGESAAAAPIDDTDVNVGDDDSHALVSEPAACPFCVQPEFGITYEPPSFRRGLTYVNQAPSHPLNNTSSAMSSSSSLASAMSGGGLSPTDFGRRRTMSLSATSPAVITTDRIRPDWHQKLAGARAHAARRSAAATALHSAAYLMGNRNHETDGRGFSGFGRRGILRRATGNDSSLGAGSAQLNMLALMSERYAERYASSSAAAGDPNSAAEGESTMTASPRGTRRSRMDDLEEMMMMEAIRMSLASEEERRKREEKDAKKEAKKKDKENKKAEKMARKAGVYRAGIESPTSESSLMYDESTSNLDKGKGVQQNTSPGPSSHISLSTKASSSTVKAWPITEPASGPTATSAQDQRNHARAQLEGLPSSTPYTSNPYRPSHLRNLSNASSSASSVGDSAGGSPNNEFERSNSSFEASPNSSGVNITPRRSTQDSFISGTAPVAGSGNDPMFNFRSLAAMVGEDEKPDNSAQLEPPEHSTNEDSYGTESRGVKSKAHESDKGNGMGVIAPGPTTLHAEDRASHVFREGAKETPELKITSPTRTNSNQAHSNEVGEVKAMEANVLMNTARPIS